MKDDWLDIYGFGIFVSNYSLLGANPKFRIEKLIIAVKFCTKA